jgi:hypothetical protein
MPRAFSSLAQAALQSTATNEAFIPLVTITHDPTGDVFRVCRNSEPITSRGQVFAAYGFDLTLPVESGEEIGNVTFVLDNADMLLVDMVRRISDPAHFLIEVVLASAPDNVEYSVADLLLREVSWDANKINGKLMLDDVLNQQFPKDVFDPIQYAGLF